MDHTLTSANNLVGKKNIFKMLWNRPGKKLRCKNTEDVHSGYKASGREALDEGGNKNSLSNEEIRAFKEKSSKKGKFFEEFTKAKVKKSCKEKGLQQLKVEDDSKKNGPSSTEKSCKDIYPQSTYWRTENVANFKMVEKETFAKAGLKTSRVKEEGSVKLSRGWRQLLCFPIFKLFRSGSRKRKKRILREGIEVVEQDREMHRDDMMYVMPDASSDGEGKSHAEMGFSQQKKRQITPIDSITFENYSSDEYKAHEEINETFPLFKETNMENEPSCDFSETSMLDEKQLEQFNENTLSKCICRILEHQHMYGEVDELLYDNCRKTDTEAKLPVGNTGGLKEFPIASDTEFQVFSSYESIVASSKVLYETGEIATDVQVASKFPEFVKGCDAVIGIPLPNSSSSCCATEGVAFIFETESPIASGNFQTDENSRTEYSEIMDGECECNNKKGIMQEEEICCDNCRKTVVDEISSLGDSPLLMGEIPFHPNIENVSTPWFYSTTPSSNLMYEAYETGRMPFNNNCSSAFVEMMDESERRKTIPVQTSSGFCVCEFESFTLGGEAPITSGSFHMEEHLPERIYEIVYEEYEYLYEIEIEKDECLCRGYKDY